MARRAASRAPDGRLRWATHFGGDGKEWAGELAVDSRGASSSKAPFIRISPSNARVAKPCRGASWPAIIPTHCYSSNPAQTRGPEHQLARQRLAPAAACTSSLYACVADSPIGEIGVVCNTSDENGVDKTTTVDEFYSWRTDDQRLPADL